MHLTEIPILADEFNPSSGVETALVDLSDVWGAFRCMNNEYTMLRFKSSTAVVVYVAMPLERFRVLMVEAKVSKLITE